MTMENNFLIKKKVLANLISTKTTAIFFPNGRVQTY